MTTYSPGFQSDLLVATNIDFSLPPGSGTGSIAAAGQLLIGTGNLYPLPEIAGGFITSTGGTITVTNGSGAINLDLAGGSVGLDSVQVNSATAPGVNPVVPTGGGLMSILGTGSISVASAFPIRTHTTAVNQFFIEAQAATTSAAGGNVLFPGMSYFNSAQFTVDASGFVSSIPGAGSINIVPDVGITITSSNFTLTGVAVVPIADPVTTNGLTNADLLIQVQVATEQALSAIANSGLASFNSLQFDVDPASGWVSLLNGLSASSFGVQAFTAPGTSPVLPTAGGLVTINGSIVAAHAIPLRSDSLAANTINIEAQYSNAAAADLGTNAGMCSFDSTQFTVSATGYVQSLASVAFVWQDFAPGALAITNGYFATGAGIYTLPVGALDGQTVEIVDQIGGGVAVVASVGQSIQISNVTTGVARTATSTQSGDALRLIFRLSALKWICVPGAAGNWILT